MATLLFAYSVYNAKKDIYDETSKMISSEFKAFKPDIFLNNPEYLTFKLEGENWQKDFVSLVASLKKTLNAYIQKKRETSNAHIVYRFGLLEMQSAFFQYPPDLEDDD